MKIIFRYFYLLLFLSLVLPSQAALKFDKVEFEARVKSRWEAIVKHEFGEAYKYETPTYRAVFTKELYVSQFSHGVDWTLMKIRDVKYDPATAVATLIVDVETKPKNSKELSTVKAQTASVEIREKWLHIKSRWWHSSSE